MTKKDYIKFAGVIKEAVKCHGGDRADPERAIRDIADELCNIFASDNPHFNRGKFIDACGFHKWPDDYQLPG